MKYFTPVLGAATDQTSEKFGGLPTGLPTALWPTCGDCGRAQTLVGKFSHDPIRLDLGREERRLYVFQCEHEPGMCATWEFGSGANACVVVEPEQSGSSGDEAPAAPIYPEAGIERWIAQSDAVPDDEHAAYLDEQRYLALGEEAWNAPVATTRFGSVPSWIQSPDEAPKGWAFLGQIDAAYRFTPETSSLPDWLRGEPGSDGAIYADGPNFGGGLAYLFIRERLDQPPEIGVFWQCG